MRIEQWRIRREKKIGKTNMKWKGGAQRRILRASFFLVVVFEAAVFSHSGDEGWMWGLGEREYGMACLEYHSLRTISQITPQPGTLRRCGKERRDDQMTFPMRYANNTPSLNSSRSLSPTPVLNPKSPFLPLLSTPCSVRSLYFPAFPRRSSLRI